jgi:lipopolysaccharide transport system permease protein
VTAQQSTSIDASPSGAARRRAVYVRDLLHQLVGRDMKLRYKRSVLGILWSLLNPLAQLLVLSFVFQRVAPLNIPHYPLFAFTGVLAWTWFTASITAATVSIVGNRELIRHPGFPVAILPAVPVLSNLIHFAIAMALLVLVLVIDGGWLTAAFLALPLVAALQFVVTLGLGYCTAALQVRFRDTSHILAVMLLLGFFITPVFYRPGSAPDAYRALYLFNPMAILIDAYRAVLVEGRLPDAMPLLALGAVATILLWLGHWTFNRAHVRFAEET